MGTIILVSFCVIIAIFSIFLTDAINKIYDCFINDCKEIKKK